MSETPTPSKNLRNRQITILAPGNYSFLHYGHFRFFQDCKSAFSRVNLIVGIHDSADSLLTAEEKALTLSHVAAVDEVILHMPQVNRQLMDKHHVDYVALWVQTKSNRARNEEILCLPGYPQVSTLRLAERISDEEEDFIMHIVEDQMPAWECGMTSAQLHWRQFKRYLRKKAAEWFPQYVESHEDRTSRYRLNHIIRRSTRFFDRLLKIERTPSANRP